jgi:hypothetical protein
MNPLVQKAVFESVLQHDDVEAPRAGAAGSGDGATTDFSEIEPEELAKIQKWARIIKYAMIIVATLCIICAFYNIGA